MLSPGTKAGTRSEQAGTRDDVLIEAYIAQNGVKRLSPGRALHLDTTPIVAGNDGIDWTDLVRDDLKGHVVDDGCGGRWYVVQTHAGSEYKARLELHDQAFHCFLPECVERISHARKVTSRRGPLFPGYLFVSFDVGMTAWRSINGTRGVVRLIS